MELTDLKIIEDLINQYIPKIEKERKSLLDVAGFPNYENVLSNFYAFFLDKEEDHQMSDLFLKSLLDLIELKKGDIQFQNDFQNNKYSVHREVSTNKGGRVDIILKNENSVIIIENKIYHTLDNDFDDYYNSFEKNNKIGVLLTIYSITKNVPCFVSITHQEFVNEVKNNLNIAFSESDDRYLLFLKDFFKCIERFYPSKNLEKMKESVEFYLKNIDKIDKIKELNKSVDTFKIEQIRYASQMLGKVFKNTSFNPIAYISINEDLKLWYSINVDSLFHSKSFVIDIRMDSNTVKANPNIFNNEELKEKIKNFNQSKGESGWKIIASKTYENLSVDNILDLGNYIKDKLKEEWGALETMLLNLIDLQKQKS